MPPLPKKQIKTLPRKERLKALRLQAKSALSDLEFCLKKLKSVYRYAGLPMYEQNDLEEVVQSLGLVIENFSSHKIGTLSDFMADFDAPKEEHKPLPGLSAVEKILKRFRLS